MWTTTRVQRQPLTSVSPSGPQLRAGISAHLSSHLRCFPLILEDFICIHVSTKIEKLKEAQVSQGWCGWEEGSPPGVGAHPGSLGFPATQPGPTEPLL